MAADDTSAAQSALSDFTDNATLEDEIEIEINYDILKQVSEHLYTNPRRAIEELVCNSYDAGATECYVSTPQNPDGYLQVLDNGISMDKTGLEVLWEVAGGKKKRLADQGEERTLNGRKQIGKFGVGKLAAFALGRELTHVATKNGETRIITVSQDDIEGHGISNPPSAKIYRMSEAEAKDYLDDFLSPIPDPWAKDWDSWTLAVVNEVEEDSSGRDLKAKYLDQMIRTAIPRDANFTVHRNGNQVNPRQYPENYYTKVDDIAEDEDLIDDIQSALKRFWRDRVDEYDSVDEVPASDYKVTKTTFEPYGDESEEKDALDIPNLGPFSGWAAIFEDTLTSKKLKDRKLHDHGFKIRVRGKLLNRGSPLFNTSPTSHKFFSRFVGEFEVPRLDESILVQRDSVQEGVKPEVTRAVAKRIFSTLRNRAENEEEKKEYDPGEFGNLLHSISPHKSPKALKGLVDRTNNDYPKEGWDDVDVELAEHGHEGSSVSYDDSTIYVNQDHPLFNSLREEKDLPEDLIKVIGEALSGQLLTSGYLSYYNVSESRIEESLEISEDVLKTASRYMIDPAEYHIEQLESTSYEGDDEFEQAVADALDSIGLEVKHHGGSGDSDLIITIGQAADENYRISVEVKGKKGEGEKVSHKEAKFGSVIEHMESDDCDSALFIAREFQLEPANGEDESKFVKQFKQYEDLTVLNVAALQEILRKHTERGFNHERVKNILTSNTIPGDNALLEMIEQEWQEMPMETGVARTVLRAAREIYLDETIDEPSVGMVRQALRDDDRPIGVNEIVSTLTLAEGDTAMVEYNEEDRTFSVNQKPEQILKEMSRDR